MSLQLYNNRVHDLEHGRVLGRVVDSGPFGLRVEDEMGRRVGEITPRVMCGGAFLEFRELPSPFSPPPLGPRPLHPPRGL